MGTISTDTMMQLIEGKPQERRRCGCGKSYVPKEINVLQTQSIRHYKDPHIGGATMFHDLLHPVR